MAEMRAGELLCTQPVHPDAATGDQALAASTTPPPADGAWLDPSTADGPGRTWVASVNAGRASTYSCADWSNNGATNTGLTVTAAGAPLDRACNTAQPIACCDTPSRTGFAGFTAATTNGNGGGRAAMHARCAAEYPDSHLCHMTEYVRASSGTPVPSQGAWLDPSGLPEGGSTTYTGLPSAGRDTMGWACAHWTLSGTTDSGAYVLPTTGAGMTGGCNAVRSLACCF
jgi:hypothetical protein